MTRAKLRRGIGTAGIVPLDRLRLVRDLSFLGFHGALGGGDHHLLFEAALELIRQQEPVAVILKT